MPNIVTLPFPARQTVKSPAAKPQPGYRYRLALQNRDALFAPGDLQTADPQQTGLVGAYRPGIAASELKAVDLNASPVYCYVWDDDLLNSAVISSLHDTGRHTAFRQHGNHLTLLDAGLQPPEVRMSDNGPLLCISPRFELEWATEGFASQLGLLQLVESSRTLQFENGEIIALMDTDNSNGPVLYLNDPDDDQPVKAVCSYQARGEKQCLCFNSEVSQPIPHQFGDKQVISLSVLEKYVCHFMQNAGPEQTSQYIWTPVHLPIVWGWSIRVQQRFDGVWDIFRKKLILPTPSTETPRLPVWQSNSLCYRRFEDT
ncbi:MAG: hypothetical protein PHW13_01080 [Methylococcales bacterium]|nr:hypothetical protein [Methylococcales bacterium]